MVVARIAFILSSAQLYLGQFDNQKKLIADERFQHALHSESGMARSLLTGLSDSSTFFEGQIESSFEGLQQAFQQALLHGVPGTAAPYAYRLAVRHRWRGERDEAQPWFEQAMSLSISAKVPPMILTYTAGSLANTWFWDGDEGLSEFAEALNTCSREIGARIDFSAVDIDAVTGDITSGGLLLQQAIGVELFLIKIARSDAAERAALFEKLERVLERAPAFTKALFFLARASADPVNSAGYFKRARDVVQHTQAQAFKSAIDSAADGKPSFLDSYLRRFKPQAALSRTRTDVRLEPLREQFTVGEQSISLTKREAAFLAYIARQRIPSTREEIQDAIWPEIDERAAATHSIAWYTGCAGAAATSIWFEAPATHTPSPTAYLSMCGTLNRSQTKYCDPKTPRRNSFERHTTRCEIGRGRICSRMIGSVWSTSGSANASARSPNFSLSALNKRVTTARSSRTRKR